MQNDTEDKIIDRDVKWLRECKFRSKTRKSGLAHKIAQEIALIYKYMSFCTP